MISDSRFVGNCRFLRCRLLVPRRLHLENRADPTNRELLIDDLEYNNLLYYISLNSGYLAKTYYGKEC